MEGSKDFPPDFIKPFEVTCKFLKICNIGLFEDVVPSWQKYPLFIFMTAVGFFNLSSMWMYNIRTFGPQADIDDMVFMATSTLVVLLSALVAFLIFLKKKKIDTLIYGLADVWKTENLSDVQIKIKNRRLTKFNFSQKVFYWMIMISLFQNTGIQFVYTVVGKIRDEDYGFKLPFGYVYPFDPLRNWWRYLLTYFIQIYGVLTMLIYNFGIRCLIYTVCAHLSTQFALLGEDIKNATPTPNKNVSDQANTDQCMTIERIVQHHQELIKLVQLTDNIFNRTIFIELCCYAFILCLFSIKLVVTQDAVDKFTNVISLLTVLLAVYMLCYYCEMVKHESESIAEAAYENPWYEGGVSYQKTIKFIIMRAQLPCQLTSLKYAPISLTTFTKVVSTTYSYFSLAMTVYGDN